MRSKVSLTTLPGGPNTRSCTSCKRLSMSCSKWFSGMPYERSHPSTDRRTSPTAIRPLLPAGLSLVSSDTYTRDSASSWKKIPMPERQVPFESLAIKLSKLCPTSSSRAVSPANVLVKWVPLGLIAGDEECLGTSLGEERPGPSPWDGGVKRGDFAASSGATGDRGAGPGESIACVILVYFIPCLRSSGNFAQVSAA